MWVRPESGMAGAAIASAIASAIVSAAVVANTIALLAFSTFPASSVSAAAAAVVEAAEVTAAATVVEVEAVGLDFPETAGVSLRELYGRSSQQVCGAQ